MGGGLLNLPFRYRIRIFKTSLKTQESWKIPSNVFLAEIATQRPNRGWSSLTAEFWRGP
jgi:hypothetical protein